MTAYRPRHNQAAAMRIRRRKQARQDILSGMAAGLMLGLLIGAMFLLPA